MYAIQRIILVAGVTLILLACGGSKAPSEVEIVLKEWAIEPQEITVQAGQVTFTLQNAGNLEHDFKIEEMEGKSELILPQGSGTWEVSLSPGSYSVICSVPGHKEAGMVGTLIVEE